MLGRSGCGTVGELARAALGEIEQLLAGAHEWVNVVPNTREASLRTNSWYCMGFRVRRLPSGPR